VLLYIQTFWQLFRLQYYLLREDFDLLYQKVREYPCSKAQCSPVTVEHVCHAMDIACIWYPKHVLCLQRSAATVCLLRSYGVPAEMVIGVQQMPFRAHAWVEVEGGVVNDKQYTGEMYAALVRC
jgi:hypothetical protein